MSNNNSNGTPLQLEVKQGNYKKTEELLNEYGLTIDDKWLDYKILIDAVKTANPKMVQLLLNYGCRVNKPRDKAYSPLHCAVEKDYVEIVKILLEHGANANAKLKDYTPLHLAINTRSLEVIKLLLAHKANICAKDCQGATPIHRANEFDNPSREILDLMLIAHEGKMANSIDQNGLSIFHVACSRNLPGVVENFLQRKTDVNSRVNAHGRIYSSFTGLHFAAMFYQVDVIEVLLKYKVNVNALCDYGLSALWMAAKYNFSNEIAHKLNNGVLKNKTTDTKLPVNEKEILEFMSSEVRIIQTVHLLLENKSNVNLISKKGIPLLFEAYTSGLSSGLSLNFSNEISNKTLIKDICIKFSYECRKKNIEMLISHGLNVNVMCILCDCGEKGSLLHYMANNTSDNTNIPGWKEIAKMILTNGGDPNMKSTSGDTPLHKAVKSGCYKCVRLLLKFKANPNSTDEDLCTPLHYAKHKKIIKALVDGGANVNAKDRKGQTPSLKVDEGIEIEEACYVS